jgi:5'-deoxynucleotidase YfbR-like HD superfamily hydrolase
MNTQDRYIQTYSGHRFHPFDYTRQPICIQDIAHALSNICRFTGHTKEFYSVAQHSVLCSLKASPEAAFYALMHDASEAYLGDVSKPIKSCKEMTFYERAEMDSMYNVVKHFKINFNTIIRQEVKEIDARMLFTEKRDLLPHTLDWDYSLEPYEEVTEPLPPQEAKLLFLKRFAELYQPE